MALSHHLLLSSLLLAWRLSLRDRVELGYTIADDETVGQTKIASKSVVFSTVRATGVKIIRLSCMVAGKSR